MVKTDTIMPAFMDTAATTAVSTIKRTDKKSGHCR